ncbi:ribosome hibernation factor-recruiting GTPase MRF [Gordonia sp. DT219]|uniref:ribosome hibernation factor-recruiting GTPase MRF n=1 Tax=Gordonia sp. DT219 TaxID=3416658 RepID=UPI003CFAB665
MVGIEPQIFGGGESAPRRTPVTLVTGLEPAALGRAAHAMLMSATVLVHHDLRVVASGRVIRTVTSVAADGSAVEQITEVVLEHGCVSCTLREDLLPLLRRLHQRGSVDRIVLQLDPLVEPEALSWAIDNVIVSDMPGFIDGPAGRDVQIVATLTCVSESGWLEDATGDLTLAEAGMGVRDDDERTLAQLAVAQVGFADALIVQATDPAMRDAWQSARLMAVLRRVAPRVPIAMELPQRRMTAVTVMQLLRAIPEGARRGRIDGPHDPLLRGQPPLVDECGVGIVEFNADRPFHPRRLHEALDVLLDGVVCTRGRLWLATGPDEAYWIESAGEALRVATGGRWLAAMDADELAGQDPERRAMAALRWRPQYGDRHSALVIVTHRADGDDISQALAAACLDDAEMAAGPDAWREFDDPFGTEHTDPCDEMTLTDPAVAEYRDTPRTQSPREEHP